VTGETDLTPVTSDEEESIPMIGLNAVAVWLLQMNNSLYVWLSDRGDVLSQGPTSEASFNNLIVGMPNTIAPTEGPMMSTLISSGGVTKGSLNEEYGDSLARRLATRLCCQIFLSEQLESYYLDTIQH
jgi:hypothetical protein